MQRLRPVLVVMLIIVDVAILIGTPFLERMGEVPRSLRYAFANIGSDPAASALPLVRLMLGGFMLAFIIDLVRGSPRYPRTGSDPAAAADLNAETRSRETPEVSILVRDRWHDLPEWTWVDPGGSGSVEVGDTIWQVHRFSVTVESSIDFDEVLRRIEIHDAFRQLAEDPDDLARRRAVVMALTAGQHWPFLGRSTFGLSTMRITTAGRGSVVAGLFVLHNQALPAGGAGEARDDLSYLVVPTTAANRLVQNDPDRLRALVDQFDPDISEPGDGQELHRRLAAAVATLAPKEAALSPGTVPSQEAVFRIQQTDQRYVVSVARVDRVQFSDQIAAGFPIGTPFEQVTPTPPPLPITAETDDPESPSDTTTSVDPEK
jgi:hypothetical protein